MQEEQIAEVIKKNNYFLDLLINQSQQQEQEIIRIREENESLIKLLTELKLLLEDDMESLKESDMTIESLNSDIEQSKRAYKNLERKYESLANSTLGKITLLYRNFKSERNKVNEVF